MARAKPNDFARAIDSPQVKSVNAFPVLRLEGLGLRVKGLGFRAWFRV